MIVRLLGLLLVTTACLFVSCNCSLHWEDITYINGMDTHVWLYRDGTPMPRAELAPGESYTLGHKGGARTWSEHLVAKDGSGNIVWDENISWDHLKTLSHQIVIGPSPAAAPTASPVPP